MNEDSNLKSLLADLGSSEWHTRVEAVRALRKLGDKRAVEPVIGTLSDENKVVRKVRGIHARQAR